MVVTWLSLTAGAGRFFFLTTFVFQCVLCCDCRADVQVRVMDFSTGVQEVTPCSSTYPTDVLFCMNQLCKFVFLRAEKAGSPVGPSEKSTIVAVLFFFFLTPFSFVLSLYLENE